MNVVGVIGLALLLLGGAGMSQARFAYVKWRGARLHPDVREERLLKPAFWASITPLGLGFFGGVTWAYAGDKNGISSFIEYSCGAFAFGFAIWSFRVLWRESVRIDRRTVWHKTINESHEIPWEDISRFDYVKGHISIQSRHGPAMRIPLYIGDVELVYAYLIALKSGDLNI